MSNPTSTLNPPVKMAQSQKIDARIVQAVRSLRQSSNHPKSTLANSINKYPSNKPFTSNLKSSNLMNIDPNKNENPTAISKQDVYLFNRRRSVPYPGTANNNNYSNSSSNGSEHIVISGTRPSTEKERTLMPLTQVVRDKYKNMCIKLLKRDKDLTQMWNELYGVKNTLQEQWLEKCLLNKKRFLYKLEMFVNNVNCDNNNNNNNNANNGSGSNGIQFPQNEELFLKKEITFELKNSVLDYSFSKKFNEITNDFNSFYKLIESFSYN